MIKQLEKIKIFEEGLPTSAAYDYPFERKLRGLPIDTRFFLVSERNLLHLDLMNDLVLAVGANFYSKEYRPILKELQSLSEMDEILTKCDSLKRRYEVNDHPFEKHSVCYMISFEKEPILSLKACLLECYRKFRPWEGLTSQENREIQQVIFAQAVK